MTKVSELARSRELFINLTLRELRTKYKRSVLGWTWSLLNPLAIMLIFTLVFRFFLKVQPPVGEPSGLHNFGFFLLCGFLPWNFLANGLVGSMSSIISNGGLIKKVYFPREVLVVANVASWGVSLMIEMGVLAVALMIVGNFVLPWLPVVVLLIVLEGLFATGIGLLLSVLNVYFRDVQHFINIFLQIWFYATPVVYPINRVPAKAHALGMTIPVLKIYRLNPMVRFLEAFRDLLYNVRFPSAFTLLYLVVSTAIVVVVGRAVFSKLEPRLAEEL